MNLNPAMQVHPHAEHPTQQGVIYAPWEKAFTRILTSFEQFIHRETTSTRFSQIAAVSVLGGIGFTMSIFIAELAFAGQDEYLLMAKTGVLAASLLAGMLGFAWLGWLGREHE